jgi:hypothetical protein
MDPDIFESSRKAAERAELLDDIECMADQADAIEISSEGEATPAAEASNQQRDRRPDRENIHRTPQS